MRHRVRGRHLGRTPSHRKAMFRNMAVSLIRSYRVDEDDPQKPRVAGRITTTVAKAKELRPFVEKLVTMARKAVPIEQQAEELSTSAERNSSEWKTWRESDQWNQWNQAIAPAVALRRRAFSLLRDDEAVDILFSDLAEQFIDRPGGYTRIIKLASRRLGDAGQEAFIEFVGNPEMDRVKTTSTAPVVSDEQAVAPVVEEDEPVADEEASSEEEVAEEESTTTEAEASTDDESAAEETDEEKKD